MANHLPAICCREHAALALPHAAAPTDDAGRLQTYKTGGKGCGACGWGLFAHECPVPHAAAPAIDRIDSERLGRALWNVMYPEDGCRFASDHAAEIAREYVALAPEFAALAASPDPREETT